METFTRCSFSATCPNPVAWVVGYEIDEIFADSYETCTEHLAPAALRLNALNPPGGRLPAATARATAGTDLPPVTA